MLHIINTNLYITSCGEHWTHKVWHYYLFVAPSCPSRHRQCLHHLIALRAQHIHFNYTIWFYSMIYRMIFLFCCLCKRRNIFIIVSSQSMILFWTMHFTFCEEKLIKRRNKNNKILFKMRWKNQSKMERAVWDYSIALIHLMFELMPPPSPCALEYISSPAKVNVKCRNGQLTFIGIFEFKWNQTN